MFVLPTKRIHFLLDFIIETSLVFFLYVKFKMFKSVFCLQLSIKKYCILIFLLIDFAFSAWKSSYTGLCVGHFKNVKII